MQQMINRFIDVPTADPDDTRRRRLLNIILAGFIPLILLSTIYSIYILVAIKNADPGVSVLVLFNLVFLVVIIGTYFINRYWAGWIASSFFLLVLTGLLIFSDSPAEVANGRSLFVFSIPIILASVLLRPYASFIFAGITGAIISYLAISISTEPNTPAIIGFLAIALISWLSARSLDQTLNELRRINANLDGLVEQKTQELAKALSRELVLAGRNRAVLESIADGVIVFDMHGKAIQTNPSLSKLLGIPHENLAAMTINDLAHSEALDPKSRGTLAGLLTTPEKSLSSYRLEWGRKTLSISSAQVLDNASEIVGTVAVFRDFTSEAELEKMKNTFVAVVSHELRTPLNAIMGYAEMLKESVYGSINEKQSSATERIMVNTQRLLGMVGDLLDEAQMKAGKLSIRKQAFKTSSLLENMHNTLDKITIDKGLYLTDELDANMPETIIGDSQRLQQILVNLVNNSAKFTEKGGIHVRILRGDENHWMLEITDTGQGIPEQEIPFIFETFRQVESTTTREHGGFGLGLAIVKQLVELMKGQITVKTELNKGSVFTVTLPL